MDIDLYVKSRKKRYVLLNWYLSEILVGYMLLCEKLEEKICNIELIFEWDIGWILAFMWKVGRKDM
jgi:hypothetical protein